MKKELSLNIHPEIIANLWEKHNIKPARGAMFGWHEPNQRPESDPPSHANILGVILIEQFGLQTALDIFHGREDFSKPQTESIKNTKKNISSVVYPSKLLKIPIDFIVWLMMGWEYHKPDAIPKCIQDGNSTNAYQIGKDTYEIIKRNYPEIKDNSMNAI